jgi:hypothetical protein
VAIATLITVLLRLWVKHLLIRTQFAIGVSRQRGLRQKKEEWCSIIRTKVPQTEIWGGTMPMRI